MRGTSRGQRGFVLSAHTLPKGDFGSHSYCPFTGGHRRQGLSPSVAAIALTLFRCLGGGIPPCRFCARPAHCTVSDPQVSLVFAPREHRGCGGEHRALRLVLICSLDAGSTTNRGGRRAPMYACISRLTGVCCRICCRKLRALPARAETITDTVERQPLRWRCAAF